MTKACSVLFSKLTRFVIKVLWIRLLLCFVHFYIAYIIQIVTDVEMIIGNCFPDVRKHSSRPICDRVILQYCPCIMVFQLRRNFLIITIYASNYLSCDVIINLYLPVCTSDDWYKDELTFNLEDILNVIGNSCCIKVVLGGDFNFELCDNNTGFKIFNNYIN